MKSSLVVVLVVEVNLAPIRRVGEVPYVVARALQKEQPAT
jgi:hypothetical protein